MATPETEKLHFGNNRAMDTFILEPGRGVLLQHDIGKTTVHGFFTTPELAQSWQAVTAELDDAVQRAGLHRRDEGVRELPAWERHMAVFGEIIDLRGNQGYDSVNSDSLVVDTAWLAENLAIDPDTDRTVPEQVISAEQLALSGAVIRWPKDRIK